MSLSTVNDEGSNGATPIPPVLDGLELRGNVNTTDDQIRSNIAHAIRQGHPQVWPQPLRNETIALVGSGPSLAETFEDLRELAWRGAKVVTLNGAYHYCVARGLKPSAQVVLDARPSSARFVDPVVPECRYFLASQCDPAVWNAVKGRANVGIWHSVVRSAAAETATKGDVIDVLDRYYAGQWTEVPGGTTVALRALFLFRIMGWVRFHLFGVDSCFMGGEHHAMPQPENAGDVPIRLTLAPSDRPDLSRDFHCAPWMVKQLEDFLNMVRYNGDAWQLEIHGDGMLAYALEASAAGSIHIMEG